MRRPTLAPRLQTKPHLVQQPDGSPARGAEVRQARSPGQALPARQVAAPFWSGATLCTQGFQGTPNPVMRLAKNVPRSPGSQPGAWVLPLAGPSLRGGTLRSAWPCLKGASCPACRMWG